MIRPILVMLLLISLVPPATAANPPKQKTRKTPEPTVSNFAYDDESPRQVLDFWQAKSDEPTPLVLLIHGGGWRGGDKSKMISAVREYLNAGISVASINYRLISPNADSEIRPPVKAPLYDAARALQTIRSKAKEWNIDPQRIAATGGSAGACTSLWLAFHDDLAQPGSEDPIARQSTRLKCAAVVGAQTSLDPKQVQEWISNAHYGGHAFGFQNDDKQGVKNTRGFDKALEHREEIMDWILEYSPIELVTSDDPPIYLDYPKQKTAPKLGQAEADPTHSAMYGVKLAEKLDEIGIECVLAYPQKPDEKYGSPAAFIIEKLSGKKK